MDFYLDLQPIRPAEACDISGINKAGSANNASFSGCTGTTKQDPERFPAGCSRNTAGEKDAARRVHALFTLTRLAVYALLAAFLVIVQVRRRSPDSLAVDPGADPSAIAVLIVAPAS